MSKSFVLIKKEEFEAALLQIHPLFQEHRGEKSEQASEVIYEAPIKNTSVLVLVYSTIFREINRECGTDAIRIILYDQVSKKAIGFGKKINRVPGWERRLKERVLETVKLLSQFRCQCGSYMTLRKSKAGKEFYGCVRYPDCNHTKNKE